MKSIIALSFFCMIVKFDGFTQTNIRTKVRPPSNFPNVFDANATSNAIISRSNSFNSSADNIQNRINQVSEKLKNLQFVDEKRYDEITYSISTFTDFLNQNRLDLSNSTNKLYLDNCLTEIDNTIDNAFRYKKEKIKIPIWADIEGKGWKKAYLNSDPE